MSMSVLLASLLVGAVTIDREQDTLPALTGDQAPRTFQEMWAGFDPCAEPLEVETLKQWDEDGVTLRVVRFRIGVFRGQKAVLAAVYGYPSDGSRLPGLVQIHGGGQYADYQGAALQRETGICHDLDCLGRADQCPWLSRDPTGSETVLGRRNRRPGLQAHDRLGCSGWLSRSWPESRKRLPQRQGCGMDARPS